MPKYTTKNEPVDAKPYIVYTPDKNIVYSGDPDADISGGGIDFGFPIMLCVYKNTGSNTQIGYYANAFVDEKIVSYVNASVSESYAGFAGNMNVELYIEDEDINAGTETITAETTTANVDTPFTDFDATFVEDEPSWKISFVMPDLAEYSSITFYISTAK